MGENVVKVEHICTAVLLREMLMDEKKLCQKPSFYYLLGCEIALHTPYLLYLAR